MTELELYKITNDCELEWNGEELICWMDYFDIREFTKMIDKFLEDDGYDVNLRLYDIAFDLVPICDYYGINPENILKKW
jgi:hypothetical protein